LTASVSAKTENGSKVKHAELMTAER